MCRVLARPFLSVYVLLSYTRSYTVPPMKPILIAAVTTYLFSRCGYESPAPPAHCDVLPSGICIGYDTPGGPEPALYEAAYLDAKRCMLEKFGIDSKRAPVVRVTESKIFGHDGWTDWGTQQITIRRETDTYYVMRHESVHYFLLRGTGNGYGDHNHPAFGIC